MANAHARCIHTLSRLHFHLTHTHTHTHKGENRREIGGLKIDINLATNRGTGSLKKKEASTGGSGRGAPPAAIDERDPKLRCIDFDRGKCRRGDQCRYYHVREPGPRDRSPAPLPPRGGDRRRDLRDDIPPMDRDRDRDRAWPSPEKRARALPAAAVGPPEVEVFVTTSQPEARDFAEIAGKSLADAGLQVGLTVLQRGQDARAVLAAMAANGVKYVHQCLVCTLLWLVYLLVRRCVDGCCL